MGDLGDDECTDGKCDCDCLCRLGGVCKDTWPLIGEAGGDVFGGVR